MTRRRLCIAKPVSHPRLGAQKVVGQPIHISAYPQPDELGPTAEKGRDTDAIRAALGHDAPAIAELCQRGVV